MPLEGVEREAFLRGQSSAETGTLDFWLGRDGCVFLVKSVKLNAGFETGDQRLKLFFDCFWHPGEGFSFVSLKALSFSIPELREELLAKKPNSYTGRKFVRSKKLSNFTSTELEQPKKKIEP